MKRRWLTQCREVKGVTHDEVAAFAGIDRSTYTRYESGTRTPKPATAVKIASYLEFDASKFFWPSSTEMEHDESCYSNTG